AILEGTRIAQLIPIDSYIRRAADRSRGDGGFGSTGLPEVHWTKVLTEERPKMLYTVSLPGGTLLEIHLHRLLDTGVNITVLSLAAWPPEWPLDPVGAPGAGLGGATQCYISQWSVVITNQEGRSAVIRPLIASIPTTLWGRDVLSLW
ncbi:hypothetical protein Nmel_000766, partial [Mimus melanotis]